MASHMHMPVPLIADILDCILLAFGLHSACIRAAFYLHLACILLAFLPAFQLHSCLHSSCIHSAVLLAETFAFLLHVAH